MVVWEWPARLFSPGEFQTMSVPTSYCPNSDFIVSDVWKTYKVLRGYNVQSSVRSMSPGSWMN